MNGGKGAGEGARWVSFPSSSRLSLARSFSRPGSSRRARPGCSAPGQDPRACSTPTPLKHTHTHIPDPSAPPAGRSRSFSPVFFSIVSQPPPHRHARRVVTSLCCACSVCFPVLCVRFILSLLSLHSYQIHSSPSSPSFENSSVFFFFFFVCVGVLCFPSSHHPKVLVM